ncbi:MAG: peroxiredoxin [Ignavibacteria bacterium]|nr:peroxiredoxin [Ignavibacteria bacterium]
MALELGIKAPEFVGYTDSETKINLSDFRGKWVVLYFYPKDNTSGCTREACDFRDNYERITQYNAEVIGVSPDSIKSHKNFKSKYNLNFHLVADPDKEICKQYDVLGEKTMYGKKYLGVVRSTYIIDPEGVIRYVNPKVNVEGHVDEIIQELVKLQGKND